MLGVFGGTFDPVHMGHLWAVREVAQTLGLSEVRVVLCGVPGHRPPPVAAVSDRWTMLQLSLQYDPLLVCDDRELRDSGPCRTVDTLQSIHLEHPDHSLCLIQGSDSFLGMTSWYQWQRIFELAHVVVMMRPGVPDLTQAPASLWSCGRLCEITEIHKHRVGCVLPFPVAPQPISATEIRRRVAMNESTGSWLAPEVERYIHKRGLYGPEIRVRAPTHQ